MTKSNILVCVTQQKNCERLILHAAEIKNKLKADELHVIHVAKTNWNFLNNIKEGEAIEYLFSISKSLGANLMVLKSDDIEKTIADYAKKNSISYIIIGASPNNIIENNFYKVLKKLLKNIDIHVEANWQEEIDLIGYISLNFIYF